MDRHGPVTHSQWRQMHSARSPHNTEYVLFVGTLRDLVLP
jgi:hypothetical protein